MSRALSHSELRSLVSCEAQWDFSYGGRLAGSALKPKIVTPRMREGRAWGRAVAALHEHGIREASKALILALEADASEQMEAGVYDSEAAAAMLDRLDAMLRHYELTAEPFALTDPEHAFSVAADGFDFTGYLDGLHRDADDHIWIVEFKLRGTLSSFEQLALDRQGLRYAWAWRQVTGTEPAGVIYDERLNEVPHPPNINKNGKPSTDKRQLCTPEDYRQACDAAGVEPDEETLVAFGARKWQQRQAITFRPGELDEVEQEVHSLAARVRDLESGRFPVRVALRAICGGCSFRDICPNPTDTELVDSLYTRVPAKRYREEISA